MIYFLYFCTLVGYCSAVGGRSGVADPTAEGGLTGVADPTAQRSYSETVN